VKHRLTTAAILLLLTAGAHAFNGHVAVEGPLTVTVGEIGPVTAINSPQDVVVTLANSAAKPLAVRVRMTGLIDEWRAQGPTEKTVNVAARGRASVTFRIVAGKGVHSALYPVHVVAEFTGEAKQVEARAIRIFEVTLRSDPARGEASTKATALPLNVILADTALPLSRLRTHGVAWQTFDGEMQYMPLGFHGSAAASGASFSVESVRRGAMKHAIAMHPPWRGGAGSIFADYRVKLPACKPITLEFANAIRDHTGAEPASDGVTFRVWAGKAGSEKVVFTRHTDSKTWVAGKADLSAFAGREIVVRLESHPGPKRNTTCDQGYWGGTALLAGRTPKALPGGQREKHRKALTEMVTRGFGIALADGYRAMIFPMDLTRGGGIAFAKGDKSIIIDGLKIDVLGEPVGRSPSRLVVRGGDYATHPPHPLGKDDRIRTDLDIPLGAFKAVIHCELDGEKFDVTTMVRSKGRGLQISVSCPKRITDLSLGAFNSKATRVYYGHGYCIVEPKAFRVAAGGHSLSTSHVGFDFTNGLSLLTACDTPPTRLEVDPDARIYALHTDNNATLTIVPSVDGAIECATAYRQLYDKQAAPGVKAKAGRFVFDIWGGRYADTAREMQRMIDYGLTDSMLTMHVWQRWGYDYRLPDIYPPDPKLGTVDDMRKLGAVCNTAGIPWGLHDNYIDHYPDATGYSYDTICFTRDGQPVKAWFQQWRNAQSYRWRPDRIMPPIRRNLDLIARGLKPSHHFVDVFTSIPCIDFYDREGKYHSRLETRKAWGEAFATMRTKLASPAITTSEAGHDHLVGYLDGADCQHMMVSASGGRFHTKIACKDWQRVPWFDAVLHDKFILHGVGYSTRYQGGRPRRDHGIESDDYISAEILTGHALMIDRGTMGRGAVRKYWLAQDFIRSIAMDTLKSVTFAGGDIHRQVVRWNSGATVHVNRGQADWTVAGRTLPQYGYLAINGTISSSIERIDGVIVEQSAGPGGRYVNARGYGQGDELALTPSANRVEYLGGRRFRLLVDWQVDAPAPKDLAAFLHFTHERSNSSDKIAFQGDYTPRTPSSTWRGRITTGAGRTVHIPAAWGPGTYEIGIGLWDPVGGTRYALRGADDGTTRYRLGSLVVEGTAGKTTGVRLVPRKAPPRPAERWNVKRTPVEFGPAMTAGAFRSRVKGKTVTVTPLPDLPPFAITLRPKRLGTKGRATSVIALTRAGLTTRRVPFTVKDDAVIFQTAEGEFAYRITLVTP